MLGRRECKSAWTRLKSFAGNHSQSRFFRDVAGYTFWKRKLEKYGVSVVSMTQDFGEGSSANFAETVLAACWA